VITGEPVSVAAVDEALQNTILKITRISVILKAEKLFEASITDSLQ
jgi:hypothetical protein